MTTKANVSVIITAAGSGSRMHTNVNKIFLPLKGKPVLVWSLQVFCDCPEVSEIIVTAGPKEMGSVTELTKEYPIVKKVIEGGSSRAESVKKALEHVSADAELIAVHDGARPLLSAESLQAVLAAGRACDGAVLAVPVNETVKEVADGQSLLVTRTLKREGLWTAQTPQVFRPSILKQAYAREDVADFYDDSSLVEASGGKIALVTGSYDNIKLTTFDDFIMAGMLIDRRGMGR